MAVVILRVERGLDYSQYLIKDGVQTDECRPIPPNESATNLLTNMNLNASTESLNQNNSQGKFTNCDANEFFRTGIRIKDGAQHY